MRYIDALVCSNAHPKHEMNIKSVASEKHKEEINASKEDNEEEATTLESEDMSFASSGYSTLSSDNKTVLIEFKQYEELNSDLTQAQVNRISFYNVILEINKGIALMVSEDKLTGHSSSSPHAAIDEEEWILAAIRHRPPGLLPKSSSDRDGRDEVPSEIDETAIKGKASSTLLQQESEQTTTILWKPIGSWWEARSKKNPKVGIRNHNKRWSYLWPMINYHKFLSQCIKQLKKSSSDSDNNVSSILLKLLHEETYSVSKQLARASQFTGQQWIQKLGFYHGWINTESSDEELLRQAICDLQFVSLKSSSSSACDDENNPQQQAIIQREHIDKHISKVILKAKEEYKFELLIGQDNKDKTHSVKKNNDQRLKKIKKKKQHNRKLSSSRNSLHASGSFVSQDLSSPEEYSVCSTNTSSSFIPIMGSSLPMTPQNSHIVSQNLPFTCASTYVTCETSHYFLPSILHPVVTPFQGDSSSSSTSSFMHHDGSVHCPLPPHQSHASKHTSNISNRKKL